MLGQVDECGDSFQQYSRGKRRRKNPEARRLSRQMKKARRMGDLSEYRRLEKRRRTLPSLDPTHDGFRRLKYCRYADDFILGFVGTRSEAEEIKAKISAFLRGMNLILSERLPLTPSNESVYLPDEKVGRIGSVRRRSQREQQDPT